MPNLNLKGKKLEDKMKHIMLSSAWTFGVEPFPAYRTSLVYGRNKQDREFLPVKGVIPVPRYTVVGETFGGYGAPILYVGTDKAVADKVAAEYNEKQVEQKLGEASSWTPTAHIQVGSMELPEGEFRVIKTKEKGTILVVPGEDKTNRCLLFVGCTGGFRGGVGVVKDGTTGSLLKECSAGNNCESRAEVIALLESGQSVAFHTSGRRTDEVYLYTWSGSEVEKQHFSYEEWKARNAVVAPPIEDAEVL